MPDTALLGSASFFERPAHLRAADYREQARHFRVVAETETLLALRRRLTSLAEDYDNLAEVVDFHAT